MLFIDYNVPEDRLVLNPGLEFDNMYESAWFDNPKVIAIIEGVDHVRHTVGEYFEHKVYGTLSARDISGGAKTLVLCLLNVFPNAVYKLSWIGENCYKFLDMVSMDHDVTFDANAVPDLQELGCTFISKATGRKISHIRDYIFEVIDYVKFGSDNKESCV